MARRLELAATSRDATHSRHAMPLPPRERSGFRHPVDDLLVDLLTVYNDIDRFSKFTAERIRQELTASRCGGGRRCRGGGALLSWLLLALALAVGAVLFVGLRQYRSLRARAGCVPVRVLPAAGCGCCSSAAGSTQSYIFRRAGWSRARRRRRRRDDRGGRRDRPRPLARRDRRRRQVAHRRAALHVDAELERWQEDWRPREWFDLGVPGSPGAKQAASRVQRALLPKPVVQETYRRLEAAAAELAKEGEQAEQRVRNAGTPPTSRDSSRRRAKKAS